MLDSLYLTLENVMEFVLPRMRERLLDIMKSEGGREAAEGEVTFGVSVGFYQRVGCMPQGLLSFTIVVPLHKWHENFHCLPWLYAWHGGRAGSNEGDSNKVPYRL
jgi:hypothetical protein